MQNTNKKHLWQLTYNKTTLKMYPPFLKHHGQQLDVTINWGQQQYKKCLRSCDFKIGNKHKKQSLYFFKLILQSFPLLSQNIYMVKKQQVLLTNIVLDKSKIETLKTILNTNYNIEHSQVYAIILHVKYHQFQCLIQLPKILDNNYHQLFLETDYSLEQFPNIKQISRNYTLESLEEWFLNHQ